MGSLRYFFLLFSDAVECGGRKIAQMCKKLNGKRLRGEKVRGKVWKIISFSSCEFVGDANGNFHQKSSAKC